MCGFERYAGKMNEGGRINAGKIVEFYDGGESGEEGRGSQMSGVRAFATSQASQIISEA